MSRYFLLSSLCQGSCEGNSPAGGNDYDESENDVNDFHFFEKFCNEVKPDAESGNYKRNYACKNENEANHTAGRLGVKSFRNFTMDKGKCCGGITAGRAGEAIP